MENFIQWQFSHRETSRLLLILESIAQNFPFKLPDDIEEKLDKLYKKLDLNTGSADFIVDKEGNYVFLEINPVGQFQMTSLPCNYNLEQKIANYLVYGD